MIQLYLLSVAYLVIGSGFLLSDTHGIKMSILFSLRFTFRNNRAVRLGLIIGGFLLTIGLALFPIDPGPRIIGDLLPLINIFILSIWYLTESLQNLKPTSSLRAWWAGIGSAAGRGWDMSPW